MRTIPNRLINSKSAYLQKAAYQPIDWHEWSAEALAKAQREDKPIFLSIGAVWCHWCHVMAHECFENQEIAEIINSNFVPIKVDRDQRPDVDRRYQEAVAAFSWTAGWPLTVFLTPTGEPFFGGTYFPPESKWGLPGLKTVLLNVVRLWKEQREKINLFAREMFGQLATSKAYSFKSDLDLNLLDQGISTLCESIDYVNGGLAGKPKFHHASALTLLIYYHSLEKAETQDSRERKAIEITLNNMAKGGIYDHLLGGFFRYSTDEGWIIPHFEKMLADNAELLKLYSLAYKVFQKDLYKKVAEGIVRYYRRYGYDPEGGFYASQDADIRGIDEGGYYTFSLDELKRILQAEELKVASAYFGLEGRGKMPHEPQKNVLFIAVQEDELAETLNLPLIKVKQLLAKAMEKMLRFREEERPLPYIDKTIYTNWNGLMIEALCEYWKVFKDEWALSSAKKTMARLLKERTKDGLVLHTEDVDGFAEDYIFLSKALVALYEVTQEKTYLEEALRIANKAIDLFWDQENYGLTDRRDGKGEGLLNLKRKEIQDSPNSSVNGVAPYLFLLLGSLTDQTQFIEFCRKNLEAFTEVIRGNPLISFSYLISLYAYLKGIYKIQTEKFFSQALDFFRPFKFVVRFPVEGLVVCEGSSCRVFKDFASIF